LINLSKTTILHSTAQDFTANATCAVGDNRFVLQVIVFATLNFPNKVMSSYRFRDYCILEPSNFRFESVPAIEKNEFITASFNQFM